MSLTSIMMVAIQTIQTWGLWLGAQMQILFVANPVIFVSGTSLVALGFFYGAYNFVMGRKKREKTKKDVGVETDIPYEEEEDVSIVDQHNITMSLEEEMIDNQSDESADSTYEITNDTGDNANSSDVEEEVSDSDIISEGSFSDSEDESESYEDSQGMVHGSDIMESHGNMDTSTQQQPSPGATDDAGDPSSQNQDEGSVMQSNNAHETDENTSHKSKGVIPEVVNSLTWHLAADAVLDKVNIATFYSYNRDTSTGSQDDRYSGESPVQNTVEDMAITFVGKGCGSSQSPVNYGAGQGINWQPVSRYNKADQWCYVPQKNSSLSSSPDLLDNGICTWADVVSNSTQFSLSNPAVNAPMCMTPARSNVMSATGTNPNGGPLTQVGMFSYGAGYMQRGVVPLSLSLSLFATIPWLMWRTFASLRMRAGY